MPAPGRLPERLLQCTPCDGELLPAWLQAHDRPWLRDLLLEADAFVGRPRHELVRRWADSDPEPRAGQRLSLARHVLLRAMLPRSLRPAHANWRRRLFLAAADGRSRDQALAEVAAQCGVAVETLTSELFADLPRQRLLSWPAAPWTTDQLQLTTNTALAAGLLVSASSAELRLRGAARTVLRTAWLRGVPFALERRSPDDRRVLLRWLPPPGELRPGRRLGALLPVLMWSRQFELRAQCRWRTHSGALVLTEHDALLPGPAPTPFDSQLERDVAAELTRLLPDWHLLREPVPLPCGNGLAFPDFELRRRGSDETWWLELCGLRDPTALPGKLALLAQHRRYLLCLPRAAIPPSLRDHPRVVGCGRRVPTAAVVAIVQRRSAGD